MTTAPLVSSRLPCTLAAPTLALALALVSTACHGASASDRTCPDGRTSVADGPSGSSITVDVSAHTFTEQDADPPQTHASLVMTNADGGSIRATIGDFVGDCNQAEPVSTDLVTYRCWWAGGGDNIHVRMDGSDVVVRVEGTDESLAEDPDSGVERLRFHLSPGATVRGEPNDG